MSVMAMREHLADFLYEENKKKHGGDYVRLAFADVDIDINLTAALVFRIVYPEKLAPDITFANNIELLRIEAEPYMAEKLRRAIADTESMQTVSEIVRGTGVEGGERTKTVRRMLFATTPDNATKLTVHVEINDSKAPPDGGIPEIIAGNETGPFPPRNVFFRYVVHADGNSRAEAVNIFKTIHDVIKNGEHKATKCTVYLLQTNPSYGMTTESMELDTDRLVSLQDNYADDFADEYAKIHKALTEKQHGFVLFNGPPGTGKTSVIMKLLQDFKDRPFIYVPMIPLLLEHSKKHPIILMEDADDALMTRQGVAGSAVAAILNLTNGVLSDVTKTTVIATTNRELMDIDPALLRTGRLISKYKFPPLPAEKATALSAKLGKNVQYIKPAKLSEVYSGVESGTDPSMPGGNSKKIGY
jgi:hypothetical protein